jgi:hypothetical protein
MRVATGIAIIIAASTTMAQGQSLEEQAICAQQAKAAFQEYKGELLQELATIRATTTKDSISASF